VIPEIGISLRGRIILIILDIIFILFIFSLLKKRKISETLALLWLAVSVGMVIIISHHALLMQFTHWLGAQYPASALTMIGLLFITSLLLYFTIKVSQLSNKVMSLVQQIAIQNREMEERVEALEKTIKALASRE
jgi:hypothetical protein